MSAHLVFVYGTLKRGGCNHHLLQGAEPLGSHRTAPRFTLYDLGRYPGVRPGGRSAIHGELYRVDTETLARLDLLEDYPRLYDRVLIPTSQGQAWIYLLNRRCERPQIPGGRWEIRRPKRPFHL